MSVSEEIIQLLGEAPTIGRPGSDAFNKALSNLREETEKKHVEEATVLMRRLQDFIKARRKLENEYNNTCKKMDKEVREVLNKIRSMQNNQPPPEPTATETPAEPATT